MLAPQLGIETILPELEGKVLPARLPGKSLNLRFVSRFVNHYCLVTKLCLTLCDPMDCSPPGSSVHGILQARILEWVAIPFSRGSS